MIHNFGINRISPHTTHTLHYELCFLDKSRFQSEGERERVGPVVISSPLCLYQVYVASPRLSRGLLRDLPLYCDGLDYTTPLFAVSAQSRLIIQIQGDILKYTSAERPGSNSSY